MGASLADILKISRPLVILDTETTGVNPEEDRIVQFSFTMLYPPAEGKAPKKYSTLVNPNCRIPAETTRTHGIADGDVAGKPTWSQLAPSVAKGFQNCDYAGKNVRFDLRLIAAEMAREGVPWSYAGAYVIDADRLIQLAEPRTLSDLYRRATGQELDGAHDAAVDVGATVVVLEWLLRTFPKLPPDLKRLHEASWPDWIDSEGKFKFQDGEPVVNFGKKYKLTPMRRVEPSFWRWMTDPKQSFSDEVKEIASRALHGEFPKER